MQTTTHAPELLFTKQPITHEPELLFTLAVAPLRGMRPIMIRAYSTGFDERGATCYAVAVRHAGKDVFPLGGSPLSGAFSPFWSSDGREARGAVLRHVAMFPEDGNGSSDGFYDDYTPEQLAFVREFGEALSLEAFDRYGDP